MELVNNAKVLYTLFLCVGYGVVCGAVVSLVSLSLFRTLRHPVARAVADISLYFWSALGLFLLSLYLTDGRPRARLFVGTWLGWFLWKRAADKPVRAVLFALRRQIRRVKSKIGLFAEGRRVRLQKNAKKIEFFSKKLLKKRE